MEDYSSIEINASVFADDYDNIGYEPEVIDDSDDEMEDFFGIN